MSAPQTAVTTDHSRAELESDHSHGVYNPTAPGNSRATRPSSTEIADFEVPSGREEEWRFAAIKDLAPLFQESIGTDGYEIESKAAAGVQVSHVEAGSEKIGQAGVPEDRISAVAWNNSGGATLVEIPAELETAEETHVTVSGTDSSRPSANHIVVSAGHHSKSVVILDHVGSATLAQNVEMVLGDSADLTVVSIQDWEDDAVHSSAHFARLGRDSKIKHVVITLGGKAVRLNPSTAFAGPGAETEMLGLYFADDAQHLEHRLFVDHAQPHCTSRVTYKGALQGEGARTVWIGDVLIRAAAEGTDTYELNRNLVLTEGARADSVPNLEIETGEIEGAGHASATGRFDDEQLFYLRSRGISEEVARQLVVRGFFAELIQKIGLANIESRLMDAIDVELARSVK